MDVEDGDVLSVVITPKKLLKLSSAERENKG